MLLVQTLLIQLVLPLGLLIWLASTKHHSPTYWLLTSVTVLALLASLHMAALWVIIPKYVSWIYLLLAILLSIYGGYHVWGDPWVRSCKAVAIAGLSAHALLMLATLALALYLAGGRLAPDTFTVDLAFPLGEGRFIAAHGGRNPVLNPHMKTLGRDERFQNWRGQSLGIDILKLNDWGSRATAIQPADLTQYAIYGEEVIAPCTGSVTAIENNRPDMPVPLPDPDRDRLAGNFVLLDCDGTEILLAHLQPGSVIVREGDRVPTGALLGLVGNSGNSTEPHLHISAQRRRPEQPLIGGEPVAILFNGRFLARNDIVDN